MSIARTLTIAGSAAQGSAGIQADLKTFQERDVYGMSAITAIVANNAKTDNGIFILSEEEVKAQYFAAIEHVGVDAIKMGMLFSKEIIELVANLLKATTEATPIVVDPVMIGKMGSQLLRDDAIEAMIDKIFPLATIITPNLFEAERILRISKISTIEQMKEAAKALYQFGSAYVLVKGGGRMERALDVLYDGESFVELDKEKIDTIHTSGAGCSYSAAIAAELAKGETMVEAVTLAKNYVHAAIKYALSFNKGIGSTYHAAFRKYEENS
ncbi:bifunctional hydroxymethylpyrimidine kinase/phosphomethylpyrimidine kinase [Aquibacillus koreensis]|uniref:pyridoxal kinase n=1 Tax=Aquibacillus koreensis TaxID=279446 RepID=A0A9X3WNY9_9BACI|nr:bifunctional hydroxymethylpyrimidine kinase/phosphomethylpyrimidine kinase [Aquibacillus koreensis]MCT2536228.1 bifunctional hydroxymethylpyrimidine kinase/phosphomethylpyrimidine kinase [Aquibacillus koreensis]MDC3422218.1 bifunctional hydroxymethylpyrimidine kinase/phosphomethylpyrimidine kinase [Aquibacillus koreensis]